MPSSRGSSQPRDRTQSLALQVDSLLSEAPGKPPRILDWVAYPFSRDTSDPGIKPGSPELQADSLPTELSGKPLNLLYICTVLSSPHSV